MRSLSFSSHPFLLPSSLFLLLMMWFAITPAYSPALPGVFDWHFLATVLFMVGVGMWAMEIGGKALWAVPISFLTLLVCGFAFEQTSLAIMFAEEGMLLAIVIVGMLVAGNVRWSVLGAIAMTGTLAFIFGYRFAHIDATGAFPEQLLLLGFPLAIASLLCCLLGESTCYALLKTHHRQLAFGYGGVMLFAGVLLILLR